MADAPCLVDGCGRPGVPKKGGLCHGHHKRKAKGQPVEVELRPWGEPTVAVCRAALELGAALEVEERAKREELRLRMAAARAGLLPGATWEEVRQAALEYANAATEDEEAYQAATARLLAGGRHGSRGPA